MLKSVWFSVLVVFALMTLALTTLASAGPLEDGLAASERGEHELAFKLLAPIAAQGNAEAQLKLGWMYRKGSIGPRDDGEALKWFLLAAAQGEIIAQMILGYIYGDGLGIAQDYGAATKWFRRAAEQGNSTAQHNLGVFNNFGYGGPVKLDRALTWYLMAAKQGVAVSQHNVAVLYENGVDIPTDLVLALMWYKIADRVENQARPERWAGIAAKMTQDQIAEANRLTEQCFASQYQDCPLSSLGA